MSKLKAVKPEVIIPSKAKVLISGASGSGKTIFSCSFPTPYVIDTEGGATREQYRKLLEKNNGAYFGKEQGSQDYKTVIDEIKSLATEKHHFKTLVIDSFTHLYLTAAAIAEEKIGNEFGRDKKEANRPTRQLMRWLESIDMTVILVCHQKDKWERNGKEIVNSGTTFDGYDKLEYMLDLWLEMKKVGNTRNLIVKKSRIESFVVGNSIDASYETFAGFYGKDILEGESTPIVLANEKQVKRMEELLATVKLDDGLIDKWMNKVGVESWDQMESKHIDGCIKFCEKKLQEVK